MNNNKRDYNQKQYNKDNFRSAETTNKYQKSNFSQKNNQKEIIKKDHFNMESDYVSEAENVIKSLDSRDICVKEDGRRVWKKAFKLTTTQIRKILSLLNEIYADILCDSEEDKEKQSTKLRDKLLYLKMRCIYEAGRDDKRDKGVADFIERSNLPEYISFVVKEQDTAKLRKKFMWLFHYMEALVAYHRYLGGKDN